MPCCPSASQVLHWFVTDKRADGFQYDYPCVIIIYDFITIIFFLSVYRVLNDPHTRDLFDYASFTCTCTRANREKCPKNAL